MVASLKSRLRVAGLIVAAGLAWAPFTVAQVQAQTPSAQTSAASPVTAFLTNPTQSLAQYPTGGDALIALIRDIAATRPDALQTLATLLATANPAQQTAFGSGLGQAYKIVLATNQPYATQIAELIGNSNSENAKLAYAGATGDVAIGAAGGGGGGGGGAGSGGQTGTGGSPTGGPNTGGTPATPPNSPTSQQTFTGGGGGVSGASSSTPVSLR